MPSSVKSAGLHEVSFSIERPGLNEAPRSYFSSLRSEDTGVHQAFFLLELLGLRQPPFLVELPSSMKLRSLTPFLMRCILNRAPFLI